MYNNSTHYPSTGYQSAYPQYPQSYSSNYGYQEYGTQYTDQNRTNSQPAPPGEGFLSDSWSAATSYGIPQKDG